MKNVRKSSNHIDKSPLKTSTRVLKTEQINPILQDSQVNFWFTREPRNLFKSSVLEFSIQ